MRDKRVRDWTDLSSDVVGRERARIAAAREPAGVGAEQPTVGLALSGGGIRSAAFAMGVLQGLVRHDRLKDVDYLSTVSGGGYIGSSLTWWLTQGCGTRPGNFPFGTRPGSETQHTRGDRILNFIRQHANYLTPGGGLNSVSLFAVIMRGIFSSLFVYFQLLLVLMALLFMLIPGAIRQLWPSAVGVEYYLFAVAGVIVYFLMLGSILYSIFAGTFDESRLPFPGYRFFTRVQIRSGRAWAVVLSLAFLGTIPWVYGQLSSWIPNLFEARGTMGVISKLAAEVSAVGAALAGVSKALQSSSLFAGSGKKLTAKLFGVSTIAFVLIYALLLLAYGAAHSLSGRFDSMRDLSVVCALIAGVAFLLGYIVNLNFVGHHRMYRDRLMELFLPDDDAVVANAWSFATQAEGMLLADVNTRPYHIINTNVVLVDSKVPRYRGRGGDNFILSPLFSGSTATGWCPTEHFKLERTRAMTLPTAMAISGAAVNPDTGAAGLGPTRKRLVSILMTLLNIRLGYWTTGTRKPLVNSRPNYIFPGIRALLGVGFHEKARLIQLTDGGHFDNLALYELIRRRVRTIVVSDAGCDPAFGFNDLSSLIERVRTDFGAIIAFRTDDKEDLAGIVPSEEGDNEESRGVKLARRGYAVADIYYNRVPDDHNDRGVLLYIKSTLVEGLPLDVYDYKRKHEAFPHETTADQFFDERQFEAYRELGYLITKTALDNPDGPFPT